MDMTTIVCLAHDFKGLPLLREAKRLGCRVILLTRERFQEAEWPWEAIDEAYALETLDEALPLLCRLMSRQRIDLIVPLHERDVCRAASLRDHLCLPGMSSEAAAHFRDKLAMRQLTTAAGLPNPRFVHVLHWPTVLDYTRRVPPPWMLKPRSEAGALGIRAVRDVDQLRDLIGELGDEASTYLLEERVEGDVYHLDSLVHRDAVVFCQAHRYGVPPFEVWNHGGVFSTSSLHPDDPLLPTLLDLNSRILHTLGLRNGVAHLEVIGSHGRLYFLEAAARVGGANIDKLVEEATGICLWTEWLRMELSGADYAVPQRRHDAAALLQCLSKQERPDLSALDRIPEVVWKLSMLRHAGAVLASPSWQRVREAAREVQRLLERDHLTVVPPLTRPR